MTKRMLIDATHPEEVRVVVHNENKLEDFDFETLSKKQLKGNIYLARVTRVEPSLQAAFVEYGGNRHGFLPFSEIHPDYYRIPVADREDIESIQEEEATTETEEETNASPAKDDVTDTSGSPESLEKQQDDTIEEIAGETSVDSINEDDSDFEEKKKSRVNLMKRYKIQEVIKRRQVILVQVAKEERGNKGAALTTYLSLAGRYSVLMPNTNKGGGISRKISNPNDRKRLKDILTELKIPEGIAVIVRTAGSQRTKIEIRRDYEYLIRLWNEIRENTLQSEAPSLIYEEANLIKRAMRDLYTTDMEEILVEGDHGYKMAKSCMRSLTPSHAKKVKHYKGMQVPLYHRFQVETQIDAMHNPIVQLKSGGYIVINPTEALVAVDVNSGRATKERHIEETAFKTNKEAAEEVARQVRLRDLAGLLVIDFIDMDDPKHNREVERRLKDAMQADRARIQLGRISPFGLLEMSRQRLRPSIVENSTVACPHCDGIGTVRTIESSSLHVLRALEEDGIRRGGGKIELFVPTDVALYILNQKRSRLVEIEQRYNLGIDVSADNTIVIPNFRLERLVSNNDGPIEQIMAPEPVRAAPVKPKPVRSTEEETDQEERQDGEHKRRRRRRRRKDRPEAQERETDTALDTQSEDTQISDAPTDGDSHDEEMEPRKRRRRGKRGGRRRTRRPEGEEQDNLEAAESAESVTDNVAVSVTEATSTTDPVEASSQTQPSEPAAIDAGPFVDQSDKVDSDTPEVVEEKPKRRRTPRRKKVASEAIVEAPVTDAPAIVDTPSPEALNDNADGSTAPEQETVSEEEKPKKPRRAPRKRAAPTTRRPRKKADSEEVDAVAASSVSDVKEEAAAEVEDKPKAKPRARTRAKAPAKPRSTTGRTRKSASTSEAKAESQPDSAAKSAEVKKAPVEQTAPQESKPSVAAPATTPVVAPAPAAGQAAPAKPVSSEPKKKGWWSRITGH